MIPLRESKFLVHRLYTSQRVRSAAFATLAGIPFASVAKPADNTDMKQTVKVVNHPEIPGKPSISKIPRRKRDHMKAKFHSDSPMYEENCHIARAISSRARDIAESLRGEKRKGIVSLICEQIECENRLFDVQQSLSAAIADAVAGTV